MEKDVLVTIKGLQTLENIDNPEEVELVAKGDYYYRNGHHYIFFEEMTEGFPQPTKNTIKITDKSVEVKKKGVTNVQMIFEENKKNLTYYATPFGNLQMGIAATKIAVKEEEQGLKEEEQGLDLAIDYALEINAEHAADCQIQINVKPKVPGNLSLDVV